MGTTANLPLITGTGGVVQAGSFGNAANTFCEGNDSRLSDARTPVAHTHLTADVTDLLNSAHTWTGDNTYSKTITVERNTDTGNFLALKNSVAELGSTPASATPVTIAYRDKNNENLGYMGVYYDTDGSNHFRLYVRNKFASGAPSTSGSADYAYFGLKLNADKSREGILKATFRPYDSNTYDLGSSSYQWNNTYTKKLYLNGTEFGLDTANTWTAQNSFNSDLNLNYASTDVDDIVNSVAGSATLDNFVHLTGNETVNGIKSFPDGVIANVTGSATSATNDGSGNVISTTYGKLGAANTWTGENSFNNANLNRKYNFTLGDNSYQISRMQYQDKDSTRWGVLSFIHNTDNSVYCDIGVNCLKNDGQTVLNKSIRLTIQPDNNSEFKPINDKIINLGTSTNKWKTFNGVNPGALSLPDTLGVRGTENVNYFNVIGYLNNTGTLATIPSTATYDGWLYINAKDGADSYIIIDDYPSSFGTSVYGNNGLGSSSVGLLCLICPIRAGHSYNVRIKSDGIVSARIYPAQGNV